MTELELMANEEARHGNREALERLEAELREARMTELSALGQAQEAYEAQRRLEAKLARAVETLKRYGGVMPVAFTPIQDGGYKARTTLAELTGGQKDGDG